MNKKFFSIVIFSLIVLTGCSSTLPSAAAEQPIKVFVDAQSVSFSKDPVIQDGTTLVEFRPIFEKLGLTIVWDQKTQVITGTKQGLEIKLNIGDKTAYVNGQSKELLHAPNVVDGHTMIPLRFVGETSGKQVNWNNDTRVISIGDPSSNPASSSLTTPAPVASNISSSSTFYDPPYDEARYMAMKNPKNNPKLANLISQFNSMAQPLIDSLQINGNNLGGTLVQLPDGYHYFISYRGKDSKGHPIFHGIDSSTRMSDSFSVDYGVGGVLVVVVQDESRNNAGFGGFTISVPSLQRLTY